MRMASLLLAALGAANLVQAGHFHLADGPPTSTPATPAPATVPAHGEEATAPHQAAAAPPAESAAAQPERVDADSRKRLYAAGYRPEIQNGVRLWCRRELTLGSRLTAQKNCGTAESLAQAMQQNQRQIDDAQRRAGVDNKIL